MLLNCGMNTATPPTPVPSLRHLFLVTMTFGLVALTPPSAEALTLTLDDPNPVLVIPDSGSFVHIFTGTLSLDRNFSVGEAELLFPFINGAIPGLEGNIINFPYPGAENGGTYVGGLFSFVINSTALPGFYNERFGGGPAFFSITAMDGNNDISSSVNYTITLARSTSVPDGGFTSLLLVGALGTLGLISRRRSQS